MSRVRMSRMCPVRGVFLPVGTLHDWKLTVQDEVREPRHTPRESSIGARCERGRKTQVGAFWGCRSQEVLPGESGWLCSSASTEWQAVSAVAYRIRAPTAVGRRVHQGNIAPAGRFRDVGHVWVLQCGGEPARVRRDRRRRVRNSAHFRRHHHHRRRRRRRASPRHRRRRCRRLLRAPSAAHTPSPGRRPPT